MSALRVVRSNVLSTDAQIDAVFASTTLYRLAAAIETRRPVGRPPEHPAWTLLGYGVLARIFRSGARVEVELAAPGVWERIRDLAASVATAHPELAIPEAAEHPPIWDAFKHARNTHFTAPDNLAALQQTFTEIAVEQAQEAGLLDPKGPGSLCHPDRSRVIYGDGTVIRPMYRPPAAKRTVDEKTGEVTITYLGSDGKTIPAPTRRFDPDAADHHGHTGPVHGQNYVGFYVRGTDPHTRIVLAVERVSGPGQEADCAVGVIKRIHDVAGSGVQAVVYDGALRGVHLDEVMTSCGLVVINKVHASARTAARKKNTKRASTPRWFTLGTWEHDVKKRACTHELAAVDGAVSEVGLDVTGKPAILHRLVRRQVKRPRRASGRYHFNVAYEVPCASGPFLAWVTPHGEVDDPDHRRADATRIIAEGEDDFDALYPVRSDAESFNSALKRTLLVNRAMSLGGARQLLDVLCFAVLTNAITEHHARGSVNDRDLLPLVA